MTESYSRKHASDLIGVFFCDHVAAEFEGHGQLVADLEGFTDEFQSH
jgi:hypothetical protein